MADLEYLRQKRLEIFLTPAQREELAGHVKTVLNLLIKFAEEGICLDAEGAQDPALLLSDIADVLRVDNWELIPDLIGLAILKKD